MATQNKRLLLASATACQFVIDQLYKSEGDELLLLHVVPKFQTVVMAADFYGMTDEVMAEPARVEQLELAAREKMKTLLEPLLKVKNVSYTIKVVKGMTDAASIGELICLEAEQAQAAMVVMVRHTKGAIQEFFLGSATSFCTHHSKVPILVLPEV